MSGLRECQIFGYQRISGGYVVARHNGKRIQRQSGRFISRNSLENKRIETVKSAIRRHNDPPAFGRLGINIIKVFKAGGIFRLVVQAQIRQNFRLNVCGGNQKQQPRNKRKLIYDNFPHWSSPRTDMQNCPLLFRLRKAFPLPEKFRKKNLRPFSALPILCADCPKCAACLTFRHTERAWPASFRFPGVRSSVPAYCRHPVR